MVDTDGNIRRVFVPNSHPGVWKKNYTEHGFQSEIEVFSQNNGEKLSLQMKFNKNGVCRRPKEKTRFRQKFLRDTKLYSILILVKY